MPNIELLKELRADLMKLPDKQYMFDMNHFFSRWVDPPDDKHGYFCCDYNEHSIRNDQDPIEAAKSCGTAACLAGWCCLFNRIDADYANAATKASELLELDDEDQSRLFYRVTHNPTFEHAIKRLDWIIEHGTMKGYSYLVNEDTAIWEVLDSDDELVDELTAE